MDMRGAIRAVTEGRDLAAEEMSAVMRIIMTGEATEAQIGGFLIGLRMKGETVGEIAAAAEVMRDLSAKVEVDLAGLVDVVGTGGDAVHTFNISTASALVACGAGARVAKHGNRSVSSASGAADLLEAAGVNLDLSPAEVAQCIEEVGIGFMFAPRHHSAMRHAIGPPPGNGGAHRLQPPGAPHQPRGGRPTSSWGCSRRSGCGRSRRFSSASAASTCSWCTPRTDWTR